MPVISFAMYLVIGQVCAGEVETPPSPLAGTVPSGRGLLDAGTRRWRRPISSACLTSPSANATVPFLPVLKDEAFVRDSR